MKRLKLIIVLLAVCMTVSLSAPFSVVEVEAKSKMTLKQLKAKFPHGRYWNHVGSRKNDPNKTTDKPCTHHGYKGSGCSYDGSCGCNTTSSSHQAIQCAGYAYKLGLDAFGSDPRNWTKRSGSSGRNYIYNSLKAGDLVRINNDGHSIFITGVKGNTVTYTHCNVDGRCKIEWGRTISKSALVGKLTYVRVAPSTFSKYDITIKYNNNGGTGSTSSQMVAYEASFTIPTSKMKKPGYTLDGFYLYRNQDKTYFCSDKTWQSQESIDSNKYTKEVFYSKKTYTVSKTWTQNPSSQKTFTLIAKWKPNTYTLVYDANEGSGTMEDSKMTYGVETVLSSNLFSKENHTFVGWHVYSQKQGKWLYALENKTKWFAEGEETQGYTKVLYQNKANVKDIASSQNDTIHMVASWIPNQLTIKYQAQQCVGEMEDTIVSYGSLSTLNANTFIKEGYKFIGWHAYSTKLSQYLYSLENQVMWSDERQTGESMMKALFADASHISYISPVADDVIIMEAVWVKEYDGKIYVNEEDRYRFVTDMGDTFASPNTSTIKEILDVMSQLVKLFI